MKKERGKETFRLDEESRPKLPNKPISPRCRIFPENQLDFEIEFLEGVLENNPCHEDALIYLGHAYTARGDYERGLEIDRRLVKLRPHDATAFYNLACSYSLLGMIEESLEALQTAIQKGFRNLRYMLDDPDLANLRKDARFREMLKKFI